MAFVRVVTPVKNNKNVIIKGGVLQNNYSNFVTPTRAYGGDSWSVACTWGYSDSVYWGAYKYATRSDYDGYAEVTAKIVFKPECYGKKCTVTYKVDTDGAGSNIKARFTANGTNIYNQSGYRTSYHKTDTYTFTIPSSNAYIEVFASYQGQESGGWRGSCDAGFIELIIS